MTEYFVTANSFAAPFFSDSSTGYAEGTDAVEALNSFARDYKHPCGLYAAAAYASADAYHKGADPLARWLCEQERAKQRATEQLGSYVYRGNGPGDFEIDGARYLVPEPKSGYAEPYSAKEATE